MNTQERDLTLTILPRRVVYVLGGIEIFVIVLSLIGQYLRLFPNSYSIQTPFQEKLLHDFIWQFDVNSEANITTYYSVSMAMASSFLMSIIFYIKNSVKDRYRFHWAALAGLLLYISIDDASVIHEKLSKYLKGLPDMSGWFEYKWVIAGIAVVGILGVAFFRFWLHLDNKYKALFLASAALFFGGAVGVEMFGGHWAYSYGSKNFTYILFTTFEQGLQYGGLILLVYSLLLYIKSYYPRFFVSSNNPMDEGGIAQQGVK